MCLFLSVMKILDFILKFDFIRLMALFLIEMGKENAEGLLSVMKSSTVFDGGDTNMTLPVES